MAVTITRTAWIDDDGTGTSGTVINNAEKTTIYNQIDAALAQLAQLSGGNTFTGNQSINGVLTVTAIGAHTIGASGAGAMDFIVRNTAAGSGSQTRIGVGNDTDPFLTMLASYASNFSGAPFQVANGSLLYAGGAGGLVMNSAAAIRSFTAGVERMRIMPTGEVVINTTGPIGAGLLSLSLATGNGIGMQNMNPSNSTLFMLFYNSVGALAGNIGQTGATTVAYSTSSDARLKTDKGRVTDLSALRGVIVHDFTWTADGRRDRGVFAQEAYDVFPRAVSKGTDDRTDGGDLASPWMTDYSKFVPDLIAGWQQHDAELAALRAAFATLKG
jgi:hypothetical protein